MPQTLKRFWSRTRRALRIDRWRELAIPVLMILSLGIVLVAILAWQLPYGNRLAIDAGDIAPFTVVAPRQITFDSELLTQRARDRAAQQVSDQYDNHEASVRREQVLAARNALAQVTEIRTHAEDTLVRQTGDLVAISELNLDAETAVQILSLSDEQWTQVAREVPVALDRVMRDEIKESTLGQARRQVPGMVSGALDDTASEVAIVLTRNLIRPNTFFNAEATEALRTEASDAVETVSVTLNEGQTVIRNGDKATAEQAEILAVLNGLQTEWDPWTVLRSTVFGLMLLAAVIGALYRVRPGILRDQSEQALLLVITILWLLAARFMMVNHPLLPYYYPLAAYAMLVAVLCNLRVAQVMIVAFALILLFMLPNGAAIVIYQVLGALVGVLVVGRADRLTLFLWAGAAVAVSNFATIVAMNAPFVQYSSTMLLEALMVVILNGGLSAAIALIGYFVLGNLFGITTPLQLTELSRPTHPLLRQLLLKASGTYHHTILVSNLAERAAAAIGADALLVRVGAYYHDIGKTVRPYFFGENILDGSSPHEKLDPLTSAQIIISHVKDGVDLAQKYKLPDRIQDFIREHHGQSLVKYFFVQAQRDATEGEVVDEADFRYPGPNPRSKETAILMLADTCEAAVRAVRPGSREELETMVNRLIDERIASGELNQSNLTFRELQTVKDVFLHVLQGVHHPRIKYPDAADESEHGTETVLETNGAGEPAMQNGRHSIGGVETAVERATGVNPAMEG